MPSCVLILVVFSLLSLVAAGWGYARAFRLHLRIEAAFPGFNAFMRDYSKRRTRH